MRLLRENKRASFLAALSALALLVSFAVVRLQFSPAANTQNMQAGTALEVLCAGSSLNSTSTSATTVSLDCLRHAPKVPTVVGKATRFESPSSGKPYTILPADTAAGDVLVSYVETYSFSSIRCSNGFNEVLDKASAGGARLVACVAVVTKGQKYPSAIVTPPTQVSMITMAFAGVSTTNPVDASSIAPGAVSPSVTTDTAGTELVFGQGSDAWSIIPKAPAGTSLGGVVNDDGNSEAAIALSSSATAGQTKVANWANLSRARSVSATIALRPSAATSGNLPVNDSGTPTVSMAANSTLAVSCSGTGLTVTGVGPTTVLLNCLAAQPIAEVGTSTTFNSESSGNPTTPLPQGTAPGDVLVSYIESYAFTTINCASGWTKTIDANNGNGARLAACVTVSSVNQGAPVDKVNPPTQVTMVTTAYSGVSNTDPVDASAAAPGDVSPSVDTTTPGAALIFGEGSDGWDLKAGAPSGTKLDASVNNSGNSQVASATSTGATDGSTGSTAWQIQVTGSLPVAATVALAPAEGGSTTTTTSPTTTTSLPTTTTTSDPTTTTTAPTTTTTNPTTTSTTSGGGGGGAPSTPPVEICGNASVLTGPSSAPSGAVTVPAGNNASLTLNTANTTYWFAPGTHTLGTGEYNQIIPSNGDTYIGGPGAILDGQNLNDFAFTQSATNVTVEYLTVEDFGQNGGNQNEGVVNHDSASNWTIKYNTIEDNAGAGVMMGTNDVVEYNCLTENQQYGFSSYLPAPGPSNITLSYNEISYNDTYNWEQKDPGCGCSGGGKFWETNGGTVVSNYVHNNANVGLWFDTDNRGFNISGNYISNNYAEGIMYEISYNANISDNTFIRNALGEGPTNPGFPTGALYISESGSDSRVPGPYGNTFSITGNVFDDNWSGVILWENSDRFCGPDSPDNAGSLCTLVDPSEATATTCVTPGIDSQPLLSDCVWKTQNVSVSENTFDFEPGDIGSSCTQANGCGYNGLFSEYGITAPYKGWIVPTAIGETQNDHFSDNTYTGPWAFMGPDQGVTASWSQWTNGYTDNADGSGIHFDAQDAGSTLNS